VGIWISMVWLFRRRRTRRLGKLKSLSGRWGMLE